MMHMGHERLAGLIEYGLMIWLIALVALILFRLVTRPSQFAGLIAGDMNASGKHGIAPDRLQLLAVFLFALAGFAMSTLGAKALPLDPATHRPIMPEVPQSLLVMLGASHTIYLSGKLGRKMTRK